MNVCMITIPRNFSIFSDSMIAANTQLGNNTDMFVLDYSKSAQEERSAS